MTVLYYKSGLDKGKKLRANQNKTAANSDATKINLNLQKIMIVKIYLHF